MQVSAPPSTSLLGFAERFLAANPFIDNRVNGPPRPGVDLDVPTIHQRPFEQLVELAWAAHRDRRAIGAVLWGEAGVGKSHVLSRILGWATQERRACAIYLHNLQAAPEHFGRALLKATIDCLTEGRSQHYHGTPLYLLVNAVVRAGLLNPFEKQSIDNVRIGYESTVHHLNRTVGPGAVHVDLLVYQQLYRFWQSAYWAERGQDDGQARLVARWLAGGWLEREEAQLLNLPPGPTRDAPAGLADNQEIKQVLVALTQFAWQRQQPLILCLDQVDNLEENQIAALARFLEALIDSSGNLLVVTSGVQDTLLGFFATGVIQESARHRLTQVEVRLHRVRIPEARHLLGARLECFLEPFAELGTVKTQAAKDGLFPLGRDWFNESFGELVDVRPRDALSRARDAWMREQDALREHGPANWILDWERRPHPARTANGLEADESEEQAIDRLVGQRFQEQFDQRRRHPEELSRDMNYLCGVVYDLLRQCGQAGLAHVEIQRADQAHELLLRQPAGESLRVVFLAADHATSTAAQFRRLLAEPSRRILLVTDTRQPLPFGPKGREHRHELRERGRFHEHELTTTEYAELEALLHVVKLAREQSLELERPEGRRPIAVEEVIAAHQRHGRYVTPSFLRELLHETAVAGEPR